MELVNLNHQVQIRFSSPMRDEPLDQGASHHSKLSLSLNRENCSKLLSGNGSVSVRPSVYYAVKGCTNFERASVVPLAV